MTTDGHIKCAVCGKPLNDSQAYMRLRHEDDWIRLCCPLCFDTFNKKKDFYILRNKALEAGERIKGKHTTE